MEKKKITLCNGHKGYNGDNTFDRTERREKKIRTLVNIRKILIF